MGFYNAGTAKQSVEILQREAASLANDVVAYEAEKIFPAVGGLNVNRNGKIIRGKLRNNYGDKNAGHIRSPGAKFHRQNGVLFDSVSYVVRQYASSFGLSEEEQSEEDSDIDLKSEALAQLMHDLLIRRDRDTADFLTDNSTYGWGSVDLSSSPGDQFDNSNSAPMEVLNLGRKTIGKHRKINCAVFGYDVHWALRDNSTVLERLGYTENRNSLDDDQLMKLLATKLGLQPNQVHLWGSHYNNAALGQVEDIDPIFAKHIWLGYVAPGKVDTYATKNGSVRTAASAARRLVLRDMVVREFRDENTDEDVVKVKWDEALTAVNPELGYVIKNAVA